MAEVERLITNLKKVESAAVASIYKITPVGEGLRYKLDRLQATSLDTVERKKGVQHTVGARTARNKLRFCDKCCCVAHCSITTHGPKIAVDGPVEAVAEESVFANMLDRSWMSMEEYKDDLMDNYVEKSEEFMGLLCAVNTDLDGISLDTLNLCPSPDNIIA